MILARSGSVNEGVVVGYSVHIMDELAAVGSQGSQTFSPCTSETGLRGTSRTPGQMPSAKGYVTLGVGDVETQVIVQSPLTASGLPQDFVFRLNSIRFSASQKDLGLTAGLGPTVEATVHVAANSPGVLAWMLPSITVKAPEDCLSKKTCTAMVVRTGGCIGELKCTWRMEALNAVPDFDYVEAQGELRFAEGVTEHMVDFTVCGKRRGRVCDEFLLILEPHDACEVKFDEDGDGGADSSILAVSIKPTSVGSRVLRSIDAIVNLESVRKGNRDWLDKFPEAVLCNGSWEEQRSASVLDWGLHFFALPWKVLFTFVPPTAYGGGWVCFIACLFFIALVTAIIADLAELFGCVCGIPDFVTAISLVALGTSMPDLFASKAAASGDTTADASIVNVTGSNSVNVFLGLGLPWTMGSIYWAIKGRTPEWERRYADIAIRYDTNTAVFVLKAGDLSFGVLIFCVTCVISLCLLFLRRSRLGAELGGPWLPKVATVTCFVILWMTYIALASWSSIRGTRSGTGETLAVFAPLIALCAAATLCAVATIMCDKGRERSTTSESSAHTGSVNEGEDGARTAPSPRAPPSPIDDPPPVDPAPTDGFDTPPFQLGRDIGKPIIAAPMFAPRQLPDDSIKPFVPAVVCGFGVHPLRDGPIRVELGT